MRCAPGSLERDLTDQVQGDWDRPRHPPPMWDTGTADAISIFDGPSGMFNRGAQASGLHPMPAIDEVVEVPYDLLNDAHYASVMVGIYTQQPGFGLVAPPCGWWTAAMRFNRRRPGVMKRMEEGREVQKRMMS